MRMTVNGVTYEVNTTGEGPPLLLLHGFTGSAESWNTFVPQWSQSYEVITIDLIGHGRTDAPHDPARYSMAHALDDLVALLHILNMPKITLLGYSMGGRLALSLAVDHPSLVEALILESSTPGLAKEAERQARVVQDHQLAARIEQRGIEWFVDYWEQLPLFSPVKKLPEHVQAALRQQRLNNDAIGLANSLRGMGTGAQRSNWDELVGLDMPVLLIVGELDEKFHGIAKQMATSIRNCTVVPVAQAGHLIHVEQPQIFDTIVMDYLEQTILRG